MKQLLFISIILFFSSVKGQDNKFKLSIDLHSRIKYTLIYIDNFGLMRPNEFEKAFRYNGDTYLPLLRLNGGVSFIYNISNNLGVGMGLGTAHLGTKTTNSYYNLVKKYSFRAVSIPIFFKYGFSKGKLDKFYISVRYGGNFSYQIKSVTVYHSVKTFNKYGKLSEIFNNTSDRYFTDVGLGVGYKIKKGDKVKVEVEPNISYFIHKQQDSQLKYYSYSLGLIARYFIL